MSGERQPDIVEMARALRVLADPTRLAIFERLTQGVQCNCEIAAALDLHMNLISHHLKALREAGLVDCERDPADARWIYYSINAGALARLRDMLCTLFDPERMRERRPTCGPQVGGATGVRRCCR